jgi:hypothetical protein
LLDNIEGIEVYSGIEVREQNGKAACRDFYIFNPFQKIVAGII